MKKIITLPSVFALFFAITFTNCSKEKQLATLWKLIYVGDSTQQYNLPDEYTLQFNDDKTYSTGPYLFADSPGTWAVSKDNKTLYLYTNTGFTHTLTDFSVDKNSLWFTEIEGSIKTRYGWEKI